MIGLPAIGISICIAGYSVGLSATYAAIAVALHDSGHSAFEIAVNAAMSPLGMILCSLLLPRLSRGSACRWIAGSSLVSAIVVFVASLVDNFAGLAALRLILGISTNVMFVIGESTLMAVASAKRQGQTMSVFNTLVTLGYASGPLLLLIGMHHRQALCAAASIILFLAMPVVWLRRSFTNDLSRGKTSHGSLSGLWRLLPLLVVTGAVALFDNASLSILPVATVKLGYGIGRGSTFAFCALLGAVFVQLPIGVLSDRISKTTLLSACCVLAWICATAVFTFASDEFLVCALLFVAGGSAFGAHTILLALVAERFRTEELVTVNSTLAITWGTGSLVGVPVVGRMVDAWGPQVVGPGLGFSFAIAAVCVVLRAPATKRVLS